MSQLVPLVGNRRYNPRSLGDAATTTPAAPAATCGWPWWYLLLAAAAGAGLGWKIAAKKKKGR